MADEQGPIVSVEGVSKTFGEVLALDSVSLEFERGIVYGLLGPNGAGKTTLIRVLTTLLRPDSGRVEVAGVDVVADPTTARTRIGLAGQFAAVDDYLTGRENIEMVGRLYNLPKAETRSRAADLLERINLGDAADRTVRTYSGGTPASPVRDQPLELSAGGCERSACERHSPAPAPERPGDSHA